LQPRYKQQKAAEQASQGQQEGHTAGVVVQVTAAAAVGAETIAQLSDGSETDEEDEGQGAAVGGGC